MLKAVGVGGIFAFIFLRVWSEDSAGVESPASTEGMRSPFKVSSFELPRDAEPNNNRAIGPFCCTGHTFTVRAQNGRALGYVYFFSWSGQALQSPDGKTSYAPDVTLQVSAVADLADEGAAQAQATLGIPATNLKLGASWDVHVGALIYVVRVTRVDLARMECNDCEPMFDMKTLTMHVDVKAALGASVDL